MRDFVCNIAFGMLAVMAIEERTTLARCAPRNRSAAFINKNSAIKSLCHALNAAVDVDVSPLVVSDFEHE